MNKGNIHVMSKTGLSLFPLLQPIRKEICQSIGNKQAGFSPLKIGDFRF